MAMKRCSLHAIDYPSNYNRCLVTDCMEELNYFSDATPDRDFREMAASYSHMLEDNEAGRGRLPDPVVEWVTHPDSKHLGDLAIPDVQQRPAEYQGHLWIAHLELIKSGYLNLEDFQVIRILGKFYELQGHVGRASLSQGIEGGVWWIEEIRLADFPCPAFYNFTEPEGE